MKHGVVAELAATWSSLRCTGGDEFHRRNSTAATTKQRRKELHGELESYRVTTTVITLEGA
jgi:hypothetical protein